MPGREDRLLAPHPPLTSYYQNESQRRRFLDQLFDELAVHYDALDALISFGSGPWYRRWALRRAGLTPRMRLLDVAVGTGAVARAAAGILGDSRRVVGLDPSLGMLHETRRTTAIRVTQGIAEALPFRDTAFDFVSMGYALRHVTDLHTTFAEYYRVLRPGGRLLILDFARPRSRIAFRLARFHLKTVVPWAVGPRRERARLLMRYCWAGIEHGVPPEIVRAAIAEAGFQPAATGVRFGILTEHLAIKH
jgi:demethylmenaquinone methyltransferase/2-methoxy-6-polyprenyl-1,4-benzoquinol methylase